MKRIITSFLLCVTVTSLVFAGEITEEISIRSGDLVFSKSGVYDIVYLPSAFSMMEIGSPALPRISVKLLIPPNATATKVEVISCEKEEILGEFNIIPEQQPVKISAIEIPGFVEPDPDVYGSKEPYPGELVSDKIHTGTKCGYRISSFFINPLQYIPLEKKLVLYTSIRFRLHYKEGTYPVRKVTERQKEVFGRAVRRMVLNSEDLVMYAPPLRGDKGPYGDWEMVIIAPDDANMIDSLDVLAYWKTKKGVRCMVKNVQDIYDGYAGTNKPWDIKRFIDDMVTDSGTIWVFLFGDATTTGTDGVAHRGVWFTDGTNMPSDRYFEDLDNNWNDDGDGVYGEHNDGPGGGELNWLADVYVGRSFPPAGSEASTGTYVRRILWFEKTPAQDFATQAIFSSTHLFPSAYGYVRTDDQASHIPGAWYMPGQGNGHPGFEYEQGVHDYPGDQNFLQNELSDGYQFYGEVGHGNYSVFMGDYYDPQAITSTEVNNYYDPGMRCGIFTANSCEWGGFDQSDCCAEFLYHKGMVGGACNSRNGWGYNTNSLPWIHYLSDGICWQFFVQIFDNNVYHLGEAVAEDKDYFVGNLGDNTWNWCLKEYNTYGDPELPMWTASAGPDTFDVTHSSTVIGPSSNFDVNVKDNDGVTPINNARVCLWCKAENTMWVCGYTDGSGDVSLAVTPTIEGDTMWVTVTKHNYIPYEGYAIVTVGVPSTPTLYNLFDFARDYTTTPTLTFSSSDPQSDDIEYRMFWDTDQAFGSPDSATTGTYASEAIASYTFSSPLANGETNWWKVKARDPGGSGVYGPFSDVRSFTIGTDLPASSCSWYQTTGEQFDFDTFEDAAYVEGDSIVLAPAAGGSDTLLDEDFDAGTSLPAGWESINGGANIRVWGVGTGAGFPPPSYGTYYARILYPSFGPAEAGDTDYLVSPARVISSSATALNLSYGWGMDYVDSEVLTTQVRFHDGATWGGWTDVASHNADGSGTDNLDLSSYLPADSVQVQWSFYSNGGRQDQDGSVDNVLLVETYSASGSSGKVTGTPVVFDDLSNVYARTSWGNVIWDKAHADDSISVQVEYISSGVWALVSDGDLSGNSSGFFTTAASGTLSIDDLNTTTYDTIRVVANLYSPPGKASSDPSLLSWEVGNLSDPLSICLSAFEASASKGKVRLYWRTESEVDNAYWYIERNIDREGEWENIVSIPGQGTKPTPTEYSYVDKDIGRDGRYYYRLVSVDVNGEREIYGPVLATVQGNIPRLYALHNVYPNPFSRHLVIRYDIPKSSFVSLRIYNIAGQVITTLVNGRVEADYYNVIWDAKNDRGKEVGYGVYFLRIDAGSFTKTRKLLLVK